MSALMEKNGKIQASFGRLGIKKGEYVMKYVVEVTETLVKCVIVETNSPGEAEIIADDAYKNEEFVLTADDYMDTEFKFLRKADEIDVCEYLEVYKD